MSQNLIDLTLTTEALNIIDGGLNALETQLAPLRALTPDQRRQLTKMGDKSEAFCRQAVDVLGENPGILPANFDYPGFRRDLCRQNLIDGPSRPHPQSALRPTLGGANRS